MKKSVSCKKAVAALLVLFVLIVSAGSMATFASESVNYVENGSFNPGPGGQWGEIAGWTPSIAVGSMDLYLGDYNYGSSDNLPDGIYLALRKEANPGAEAISVSQTINNLPAGVYKLSAWMWAANNVDSFTVKITDGIKTAELSASLTEKGYKETEIEITSGTATITITADNTTKTAAMDALADDVKLVKIKDTDSASPVNLIENGTFNPGPGGQWGAIPGWTPSIAVGSMDLYLGDYNYGSSDNLPDGIYLALRKEANPGAEAISVSQTVNNLPSGVYKLSAWMWAANNVDSFTVKITDGVKTSELSASLTEKGYKETEIEITSGTATITITADNTTKTAAMDALADDIKLFKIADLSNPTDAPAATDVPATDVPATDAPAATDIPETTGAAAATENPETTNAPATTNVSTGDSAIFIAVIVFVVVLAAFVVLRKQKA